MLRPSWERNDTSRILHHRGVGIRLLPERAHKIAMDDIDRHPFHVDKESMRLLIHLEKQSIHFRRESQPGKDAESISKFLFHSLFMQCPCIEGDAGVKLAFGHGGLRCNWRRTPHLSKNAGAFDSDSSLE
jgi:hypothetical protein